MNGTKSKTNFGNSRGRGGRGKRQNDDRAKSGASDDKASSTKNERQRLYSECSEDHCTLCLNRMTIFAVGRCNHPICGKCSTRLRVLCEQKECPICRQDIQKVFHILSRQRYEDVEKNVYKMDRKLGICFENNEVEAEFKSLLEHRCPLCKEDVVNGVDAVAEAGQAEVPTSEEMNKSGGMKKAPTFRNFHELDKHARVVHERHYCGLCSKFLKLFTFERRLYTRNELKDHNQTGDPDDTSQRGHPLCKFCHNRFVDDDELFRHVRKDHYFCHFCDSDGKQIYFNDHFELRSHFRSDHFVCDEGNCVNEIFTSAFRSEIDLKGHQLEKHMIGLSKAATKMTRTVEVDFSFSRPIAGNQSGRRRGGGYEPDDVDGPIPMHASSSEGRLPDLAADFPTLENAGVGSSAGAAGGSSNLAKRVASSSGLNWSSSSSKAGRGFQEQDFPGLPGTFNPAPSTNRPLQQQQQRQQQQPQRQHQQPPKQQQQQKTMEQDFPSLPGSQNAVPLGARPPPQQQQPKQQQLQQQQQKLKTPEPDFPSLVSVANGSRRGDNLLANFRPVETAPQYRQLPGQSAAWNSSTGSSRPTAESAKKPPDVSNKKLKEAPPPTFEDDFPGLAVTASNVTQSAVDSSVKKKKKNKNKGGGFLIGDDPIPSAKTSNDQGSSLKGSANLQTAADLIFKEDKKAAAAIANTNKPSKNKSDEKENKSVESQTTKKQATDNTAQNVTMSSNAEKKPEIFRPSRLLQQGQLAVEKLEASKKLMKKSEVTIPSEDFPSLSGGSRISSNFNPASSSSSSSSAWGASTTPSVTAKAAPPPGFSSATASSKKPSAPPGFAGPKSATMSALPVGNFRYQEPPNFASRNRQLLSLIMSLIGGKSLEFDQFKALSSRLRSGGISAKDYHAQCLDLIDKPTLEKFFPQLIALLPDIKKQRELFVLHLEKFPECELQMTLCPTCGQVLLLDDISDHCQLHSLDQDFPLLSMK